MHRQVSAAAAWSFWLAISPPIVQPSSNEGPSLRGFYPLDPMDQSTPQSAVRGGDGYLAALAYLQIGTGILSLTMSLMFLFQGLFVDSALLHPSIAFSTSGDLLDRLIAGYVSLQLSVGWVAGSLQLAAGICCLQARRGRFVCAAALVSLANFPHGTMAAILTLTGLRRPEVGAAFAGGARPRAASLD